MDYLLRDSYHIGVQYGRFDLHRIINTIEAIPGDGGAAPRLGIDEGGWHAAEALVLARYFMFTQVYFHKTRVAFDIHLRGTMRELLPEGRFPAPVGPGLDEYLAWDDWRVLGLLANGSGGEHAERLRTRSQFRRVYETPEVCTLNDMEELQHVKALLGSLLAAEEFAAKSWYKMRPSEEIQVISERERKPAPLSKYSNVIANLKSSDQVFLYVRPEDVEAAEEAIRR